MAVFTIAKNKSGEMQKYKLEKDLERLVHYCCDKSKHMSIENLYPYDDTDTLVDQFLYLQKCRGGTLNSRAVHYIFSFFHSEFKSKDKFSEACKCLELLSAFYFSEYQHIACLHTDKKDRFDFHIIINPVRIRDLKIYHCSPEEFRNMMNDIAYVLFYTHRISLYPFTYITEDGVMHYGQSDYK